MDGSTDMPCDKECGWLDATKGRCLARPDHVVTPDTNSMPLSAEEFHDCGLDRPLIRQRMLATLRILSAFLCDDSLGVRATRLTNRTLCRRFEAA